MKRTGVPMLLLLALTACGSAGVAASGDEPSPSAAIPARLDVVCHDDGSTELANREVRALPDGVHVRVDNRAGEFVSMSGLGLDFSEGVTEQTALVPPGEVEVACWPGSKHGEAEPERQTVLVLDPDGHWAAGELECAGDELISSAIIDYASGGSGTLGNPEEMARDDVEGIRAGDEIVTVGYPEAEVRDIAVSRAGRIVARLSYSQAQKGGWYLGGYSACDSAGIRV